MNDRVFFDKVSIIGVGLIGGSLAISLKEKGMAGAITGVGRGRKNLDAALRLGVVDSATQDIAEGVADADLVVVAVPVLKIAAVVESMMPSLKEGAVITDVGSVKEAVIEGVEPLLKPGVAFVPGHPVAGTENSGAEAAVSGLFKDRKCILTPTQRTDPQALLKVKAMWEEAGSEVVIMDARTHDRVLAAVSHLPHMIAYSLVNTMEDVEKDMDVLSYSAGGFRDFTRIASSSPEMWADICAMNRAAILEMIDRFSERLGMLRARIEAGDLDAVKAEFERAKSIRDALIKGKSGR